MNKGFQILIVDDEVVASKLLHKLLQKISGIDIIYSAKNVDKAVFIVLQNPPDLIFLDIEMPGKNGLELIHELVRYNIKLPKIIITSSYSKYAVDAIQHNVFDYILKPIKNEDLIKVIDQFKKHNNIEHQTDSVNSHLNGNFNKLKFPNRTGYLFIEPRDIVYCTAEGNYSRLFFQDDTTELISLNLGSIEKILSNNIFIRIGRSEMINKQYLLKICRKNRKCILKFNGSLIELNMPKKTSLIQTLEY